MTTAETAYLWSRIDELEAENKALRAKYDNRKKLSPEDVNWIRRLYKSARATQSELADMYKVSGPTISRTVRGIYHA